MAIRAVLIELIEGDVSGLDRNREIGIRGNDEHDLARLRHDAVAPLGEILPVPAGVANPRPKRGGRLDARRELGGVAGRGVGRGRGDELPESR